MRCRIVRGWKELGVQKFDHWLSLWCARKSRPRNQTQSGAHGGTNEERMLPEGSNYKLMWVWEVKSYSIRQHNTTGFQVLYIIRLSFSLEYLSQLQIQPLKNCKRGCPRRAKRSLIVGLASQQHMRPQREFSYFSAEQIEPISHPALAVGWLFILLDWSNIP